MNTSKTLIRSRQRSKWRVESWCAWQGFTVALFTVCSISICLGQVSLPHWNQDEEYGGFGGPHCMVVGGFSAIMEALAARLDVRLSTPVASVAYDDDCVSVTTASGNGSLLGGLVVGFLRVHG
jgi:monoamine oxidase